MLSNVCVWVKGIEYDDVQRIWDYLGDPIEEWDEVVWHMWTELGWDQRYSSELDEQPEEVYAYRVTRAILEKLGLYPVGTGTYILFVCRDLEWASVASTTYLYTD
jgi:hypothetical protein